MNHARNTVPVLAIHPTSQGIGFVLMTSPLSPVDWGTKDARGKEKNVICLKKIAELIEAHQPEAIILEDPTAPRSQRSERIKRLVRLIATFAEEQAIDVHVYSRAVIRECFDKFDARTRHEIAVSIAKRIPAFEPFLPPNRKSWNNEHPRMSVFSAAALAITYFSGHSR